MIFELSVILKGQINIIQTQNIKMELQSSLELTTLQNKINQLDTSKKKHFRLFSYNDSEALRQSMSQLWSQVYQYPKHQPLSKRLATNGNKNDRQQTFIGRNAREAWSVYDPQKQPVYQFDVFKAAKKRLQKPENVNKDQSSSKRSGWGSLFNKDFWSHQGQKPPPFMGAFQHVQPDFGPNINISIPNRSQYNPYSLYLQDSRAESIVSPYNNQAYSQIMRSEMTESKGQIQKNNKNKYFFQVQSVKSEGQHIQAKIQDKNINQSRIQHIQQQLDHSIVWNYKDLFGESKSFKAIDPEWQNSQDKPVQKFINSQIFEINRQSNLKTLASLEYKLSLSFDISNVLSEEYILTQISKMLQNVQCQLFTLDYRTLTWNLDAVAFRPQHFFKNSLGLMLSSITQMASFRSRLSAAVSFLSKNKYRKIYSQLSIHIVQMLVVFQEIILQLIRESSLAQFLKQVQKVKAEIELLYNLVINQEFIRQENKIYDDFDFKFLHAEALIFKRIVKLARNSDTVLLDTRNLVNQLLQAAFNPLLFLLENLLFSQCPYLELNSQLYLKYYFAEPKEIINSISKKLELIKQESNEMYLICKVKEKLSLVQTLRQLRRYEKRWQKSFKMKRKLIQRIRRQHKNKLKWDQQKKKEEKMKDILQLKSRFYQTQQQEWTRKKNVAQKNKEQLQRLKRQIQQKQSRRKLMEELEKEKEKSIILDLELQQKQKLAKEKQNLLQKLNSLQMQKLGNSQMQKLGISQMQKLNSLQIKNDQLQNPSKQSINVEFQSNAIEPNISSDGQMKIKSQIQIKEMQEIEEKNYQETKKSSSLYLQIKNTKLQRQSEEIIPSVNSLDQLNRKYMQTAGAFFSNKEKPFGSKTESYFRLVEKSKKPQLQLESEQSQHKSDEQSSIDSSQLQNSQMQIQSEDQQAQQSLQNRQVDIQTCISICVDEVIRKQNQVVRKCLEFIIVDKYEIMQIIQYLRTIFMSGNGEKVQEFIRLCVGNEGLVGLKHFTDCLLFDTPLENIQKLSPSFYHSKVNMRHAQISIFADSIQHYIGFQFKNLPSILQPYFSYIHLSKYMQIFGFIVRLRHCSNLLSQSWKLLNSYKKQVDKRQRYGQSVDFQRTLMNLLCLARYKISNFIKMFQNYLFFRVIEKEYKNMRANINELNDLQLNHVKMLDNIIKYAYIDNPNLIISKNFKQLLVYINQFYQVVNKLALDDIASYEMEEVQQKIQFINVTFDKELKSMDRKLFKLNDQ